MEGPEEFYRELEKLRLRFGDLGCNLLRLIEAPSFAIVVPCEKRLA